MDFDTDMHLLFPDKNPTDSSELNYSNNISDKTKRDMFFNHSEEYNPEYGYNYNTPWYNKLK